MCLVLHQVLVVVPDGREDVKVKGHLISNRFYIMHGVRWHANDATWGHVKGLITHVVIHLSLDTNCNLFKVMLVWANLNFWRHPVHHHDDILTTDAASLDAFSNKLSGN